MRKILILSFLKKLCVPDTGKGSDRVFSASGLLRTYRIPQL